MDWTDPTGRTRTPHPVDHLGTTPPTTSQTGHGPGDTHSGFGDPIWDADYHDPDSYTGGLPHWLAAPHDLATIRAAPAGRPPRAGLHPEQHSPHEDTLIDQILDQAIDPRDRDRAPDSRATDLRWRAP